MAKVGIDEARFDPAVPTTSVAGIGRNQPLPLEPCKVDAKAAIHLLDLLANPEHEAKRKRIGEIKIGQHAKRHFAHSLQVPRIVRCLGHDRDDVAASGNDIGVSTRERGQRARNCRTRDRD
jgi:hypothetical protein